MTDFYNGFAEGSRVRWNRGRDGTVTRTLPDRTNSTVDGWIDSGFVPILFDSGSSDGVLPAFLTLLEGEDQIHGFRNGDRIRIESGDWAGLEGIVDISVTSNGYTTPERWRRSDFLPIRVTRQSNAGRGANGGFYPRDCTLVDSQGPVADAGPRDIFGFQEGERVLRVSTGAYAKITLEGAPRSGNYANMEELIDAGYVPIQYESNGTRSGIRPRALRTACPLKM